MDTIHYFKVKNVKRKTPLITVAGVALKGHADLIAIMVPLEHGGGGSSIVKVPGDVPPARVCFFGLLV